MRDIYKQLTPEAFIEVVKAKLINFIAKNPDVNSLELKREINNLFNPEFALWMRDVNKTFNIAVDLVNTAYPELGGDMRRELIKLERIEKISRLKLGDYSESTKKEIHSTIRKSISDKLTYKETVKQIELVNDKAAFYAKTIANTQLRAYSRAAKNEKANIGEVFYYEYVGAMRVKSRPFCQTMIGQTLHIDAIKKISRAEVGSAFISPCIIYCGGWNCGHDWEPDPFYDG